MTVRVILPCIIALRMLMLLLSVWRFYRYRLDNARVIRANLKGLFVTHTKDGQLHTIFLYDSISV